MNFSRSRHEDRGPDLDIEARPVFPPTPRIEPDIKPLPGWFEDLKPTEVSVSVFERGGLIVSQVIEYTWAAKFIIGLGIKIIGLLQLIQEATMTPWWKSRKVWAGVFMVLGFVAKTFGLDILGSEAQSALVDAILQIIEAGSYLVGLGLVVWSKVRPKPLPVAVVNKLISATTESAVRAAVRIEKPKA